MKVESNVTGHNIFFYLLKHLQVFSYSFTAVSARHGNYEIDSFLLYPGEYRGVFLNQEAWAHLGSVNKFPCHLKTKKH